jgi:hypothetical protein
MKVLPFEEGGQFICISRSMQFPASPLQTSMQFAVQRIIHQRNDIPINQSHSVPPPGMTKHA